MQTAQAYIVGLLIGIFVGMIIVAKLYDWNGNNEIIQNELKHRTEVQKLEDQKILQKRERKIAENNAKLWSFKTGYEYGNWLCLVKDEKENYLCRPGIILQSGDMQFDDLDLVLYCKGKEGLSCYKLGLD